MCMFNTTNINSIHGFIVMMNSVMSPEDDGVKKQQTHFLAHEQFSHVASLQQPLWTITSCNCYLMD